jgi:16S rRNA processing protein RimM
LTLSEKGHSGSDTRQILHIGQIGRPHGLAGEIRVTVMSSDPERFTDISECLLVSRDEKTSRLVQIEYIRPGHSQIIVKLCGIDEREQAEALTGCFLSVRREQAKPLKENEWFICDLVGCQVIDDKEGDLGILAEILQNGRAQDVFVVRAAGRPDLLFPGLQDILRQVDPAGRRISVHLPDGLFEVYRGKEAAR